VIRAACKGPVKAEQLIDLAGADPVLAGNLIQAANSASYTWSGKVRTLQQAVMYLGEIRATHLLISVAMKPILSVVGHQQIWEHSVEAASVARKLCASSDVFDPSTAYILGLLHDVGMLLLRLGPAEAQANMLSLVEAGCERGVAELLFLGATHGQAGADILREWRMPPDFIAAVEFHHDPETSGDPGSALLYLAEQWTEPNGDRLREDRVEHSLAVLGLQEVMPEVWKPAAR
jgi:putative nucleotidyltransferase with HDIG domain